MIILKQCKGGIVYPKDDAILYDVMIGRNGIVNGCIITQLTSNTLKISAGYGVIKGRLFEMTETNVPVKLPASGTATGKVFIVMDLSSAPYIRIDSALLSNYSPQYSNDINFTETGEYHLILATYTADNTHIISFSTDYDTVSGTNNLVKTYADWANLTKEEYHADAKIVRDRIKIVENITVTSNLWEYDYMGPVLDRSPVVTAKYPYAAAVAVSGIDDNYCPNVFFGAYDATCGNFSSVAATGSNTLYIAAKTKPDSDIVIPAVEFIRKVG